MPAAIRAVLIGSNCKPGSLPWAWSAEPLDHQVGGSDGASVEQRMKDGALHVAKEFSVRYINATQLKCR